MKVLRNIISLALIFCSIASLSVSYEVPENKNGNTNYSRNPQEVSVGGPFTGYLGRSDKKRTPLYWPNAIIPYIIEENYSQQEIAMILKAMDTIQFWTCIRFVRYSGERDYITIKSDPDVGCLSFMGRNVGGQQLHLKTSQCFAYIGQVLHTLLMAIGLVSEHNRWDRDDYVTVNMANVIEGREREFEKYPKYMTDDYSVPYDYNSVTHFVDDVYSRNGQKTIVPKINGISIGQKKAMSVRNALAVMQIYKCEISGINDSPTATFSELLPNFGDAPLSKEVLYDTYFRKSNLINV